MIQPGISPAPPGRRRTSEERATMGCTNPGHGREEIDVKQIDDTIKKFGNWLVDTFQLLGLFVIGGTIVWAAVHEYLQMIDQGARGWMESFCCSSIWSWVRWSGFISKPAICLCAFCSTSPSRHSHACWPSM
jgi:hypothetical protein